METLGREGDGEGGAGDGEFMIFFYMLLFVWIGATRVLRNWSRCHFVHLYKHLTMCPAAQNSRFRDVEY